MDRELISVTTALGVLDKPGLLYWAAEQTARSAVEENEWRRHDREQAIRWLSNARYRQAPGTVSATELGTAVHQAIEYSVASGKVLVPESKIQEEVRPFLERFWTWLEKVQPKYESIEIPVYNPTVGYAGTCDAIAHIENRRVVLDYKTTRKAFDAKERRTIPYPEAAIQVAAYRQAEWYLDNLPARKSEGTNGRVYLWGEREQDISQPFPTTDGGYVIHISPDHCTMHPVLHSHVMYEVFKACLIVAKIKQQKAWKEAIGNGMV